jgi:hypothetical protein
VRIVSSVDKAPVSVVVLSSKDYIEELEYETVTDSKYQGIKVINPYKCLEQQGIKCLFNFFEFEPGYDDYDVDYPFDLFGL